MNPSQRTRVLALIVTVSGAAALLGADSANACLACDTHISLCALGHTTCPPDEWIWKDWCEARMGAQCTWSHAQICTKLDQFTNCAQLGVVQVDCFFRTTPVP